MRFTHRSMVYFAALVASVGLGALSHAQAAEEETINAFAAWQGHGYIYPTGPNHATFVGGLSGVVYVETDEGPVDAGIIVCPAVMEIELEDATQTGRGRCTIAASDGARIYAEWSCAGTHLIGCDGEFTLTGGTGRFEGITGGGPMTVRSSLRAISGDAAGNTVGEAATGIIFWRGLHYTIP